MRSYAEAVTAQLSFQEELKCQVVGVDVDQEAVTYAKKQPCTSNNNPRLSYRHSDATDLAFLDNGSLLAIVSIETIEHIPDDAKAVAEFLVASCNPEGYYSSQLLMRPTAPARWKANST